MKSIMNQVLESRIALLEILKSSAFQIHHYHYVLNEAVEEWQNQVKNKEGKEGIDCKGLILPKWRAWLKTSLPVTDVGDLKQSHER